MRKEQDVIKENFIEWILFGVKIKDPIEEMIIEENNAKKDIQYEYKCTDIVIDTFYVTTMKHIYDLDVNPDYKQLFINRLTQFDTQFTKYMYLSKNYLWSLQKRFEDTKNMQSNEKLESILVNYTNEIFFGIKINYGDIFNNDRVIDYEQYICSVSDNEKELKELIDRIHQNYAKVIDGANASYLYKLIREIINYLPDLYRERYSIYLNLHKFSNSYQRKAIYPIIMNSYEFSSLYDKEYENMKKNLITIQNDACDLLNILNETDYQRVTSKFRQAIEEDERWDDYKQKNTGCFAIMEVTIGNKLIAQYYTYSGIYDSMNSKIRKQYSINTNYFQALLNAIDEIKNATYFKDSKWIRTPDKIEYYYDNDHSVTLIDSLVLVLPKNQEQKEMKRMFSCCERKLLAGVPVTNLMSRKLYIKKSPCSLCIPALNKEHNIEYYPLPDGHKDTFDKVKFDAIAMKIAKLLP